MSEPPLPASPVAGGAARSAEQARWAAAPPTAGAVVALAALVLVTGHADPVLLALVVALGGGIVAWGWAGLLGLPSPRGTAAVLYCSTLAVVLSVAVVTDEPWLRWLPVALAVSVLAGFLHQLVRRDGRPRLVESLSSTVLAAGLLGSGSCLVPLSRTDGGTALLVVVMAAVAVSALVDAAGRWRVVRPAVLPLGMAAGGVAAALAGVASGLPWGPALLLGVLAAAVSHAVRAVLGVLPSITHARPRLVSAVVSVLATGVLALVTAQVFLPGIA